MASEGSILKNRTDRISRERFIRLGGALGVSVAAASALAACGGDSSVHTANGSAKNTTASGAGGYSAKTGEGSSSGKTTGGKSNKGEARASGGKAPAGQEIAQSSKVPANTAVKFTDSGNPAVLVHLQNGKFVAYSAVCTHQGCTVAYQPNTGELACPCHGSIFDPSNGGAVVNGPAQAPLQQIPIKVQSGEVYRA